MTTRIGTSKAVWMQTPSTQERLYYAIQFEKNLEQRVRLTVLRDMLLSKQVEVARLEREANDLINERFELRWPA